VREFTGATYLPIACGNCHYQITSKAWLMGLHWCGWGRGPTIAYIMRGKELVSNGILP